MGSFRVSWATDVINRSIGMILTILKENTKKYAGKICCSKMLKIEEILVKTEL